MEEVEQSGRKSHCVKFMDKLKLEVCGKELEEVFSVVNAVPIAKRQSARATQ